MSVITIIGREPASIFAWADRKLSGDMFDPAALLAESGSVMVCLRCGEHINTPQRFGNFHDACLRCPTCAEDMAVDTRSENPVPRPATCYACIRRAEHEKQAAEDACELDAVGRANTLLLDGGGTREEREAAIEVIADYHFGMGCS